MSDVKGFNIQNVGTAKYVDLFGSNPAPGTPVIAWTLNNQTTGSLNQQWRIYNSNVGTNRYFIQAVNPPSFAFVGDDAAQNTQVSADCQCMDWVVTPLQDGNFPTGAYTIRLPKNNLAWTATADNKFDDDGPNTQIVLQKYDANNKNQQFNLKTIV
ncbi:hypothetical protein L218DRAFT_951708 [Marasmius fiardii PR-910]|nr:hypothetical protein L218DRAFT_951708 [Marasmius fiardii PR-910]